MKRSKLFVLIIGLPVTLFIVTAGCIQVTKASRFVDYQPQEGDVVMQSLPKMDLVRAIEGVTNSPYSHCGIVTQLEGQWVVLEAIGPVRYTPLYSYLDRGRADAYAVYRLREPHRKHIPGMIEEAAKMLNRPYDFRYRLDDENIYCSELIYKGFKATSSEDLGKLEALGTLNWEPYEKTIRKYDGGGLPLDRMMITPVGLTRSPKLELVLSKGYQPSTN